MLHDRHAHYENHSSSIHQESYILSAVLIPHFIRHCLRALWSRVSSGAFFNAREPAEWEMQCAAFYGAIRELKGDTALLVHEHGQVVSMACMKEAIEELRSRHASDLSYAASLFLLLLPSFYSSPLPLPPPSLPKSPSSSHTPPSHAALYSLNKTPHTRTILTRSTHRLYVSPSPSLLYRSSHASPTDEVLPFSHGKLFPSSLHLNPPLLIISLVHDDEPTNTNNRNPTQRSG